MGTEKKGQEGKKGKPGSAGRRNGKFAPAFARTSERKLRRILKRGDSVAAKAYAQKYGLMAVLRKIAGEATWAGAVAVDAVND